MANARVFSTIELLLKKYNIAFESFKHRPIITYSQALELYKELKINYALGVKALVTQGFRTQTKESFIQMIVIPGFNKFDSSKLKPLLNQDKLSFADKNLLESRIGVESGGIPPFGNLFKITTICDISVLKAEKIAFNAGDRAKTIVMKSRDWQKVVNPVVYDVVKDAI